MASDVAVRRPADLPTLPRYVSISEAAAVMGVSRRTVRRLLQLGALRGERVGTKVVRIPLSAIVAYMSRSQSSEEAETDE